MVRRLHDCDVGINGKQCNGDELANDYYTWALPSTTSYYGYLPGECVGTEGRRPCRRRHGQSRSQSNNEQLLFVLLT